MYVQIVGLQSQIPLPEKLSGMLMYYGKPGPFFTCIKLVWQIAERVICVLSLLVRTAPTPLASTVSMNSLAK